MNSIFISPDNVKKLTQKLLGIGFSGGLGNFHGAVMDVKDIKVRIGNIGRAVQREVAQQHNLDGRFNQVRNQLQDIENRIKNLSHTIFESAGLYERNEQYLRSKQMANMISSREKIEKKWNSAVHKETVAVIKSNRNIFYGATKNRADFFENRSTFADTWAQTVKSGRNIEAVKDFFKGDLNDHMLYKKAIEHMMNGFLDDKNSNALLEFLGIYKENTGHVAVKTVFDMLKSAGIDGAKEASNLISSLSFGMGAIDNAWAMLTNDDKKNLARLNFLLELRNGYIANGAIENQIKAVDELIEKYAHHILYRFEKILKDTQALMAGKLTASIGAFSPPAAAMMVAVAAFDTASHLSGAASYSDSLRTLYASSANLSSLYDEYFELHRKITVGNFTEEELNRAIFLSKLIRSEEIRLHREMIEVERYNLAKEIESINKSNFILPKNKPAKKEAATAEANAKIAEYQRVIRELEAMLVGIDAAKGKAQGIITPEISTIVCNAAVNAPANGAAVGAGALYIESPTT